MTDYPIKYTEPPRLEVSYDCTGVSCRTSSVEHDGDSFVCTDCGTSWANDDIDEPGELYEKWSGEERPDAQGPFDPDDWSERVVLKHQHHWYDSSTDPTKRFCAGCLTFEAKP